jgi:flagellar biogenesis protein FliO
MGSYQFASSLPHGYADAEMLFLWLKVFGFSGLLCASAYFLSHYSKKKRLGLNMTKSEKILVAETCSLGNRQFLMVAQCGKERHLLGVSPSSINHLAKLEDVAAPKSSSSNETISES